MKSLWMVPMVLAITLLPMMGAAKTGERIMLRFWDMEDIHDVYGHMIFGAHPLQHLGKAVGMPPMWVAYAEPTSDGTLAVYGWSATREQLTLFRCFTQDGVTFKGGRALFEDRSKQWLGSACMARLGRKGPLLLFSWGIGKDGKSGLYVFGSPEGEHWSALNEGKPAFYDHDAFFVVWDEKKQMLIDYQTALQRWPKKYPDNIGDNLRRVLCILSSSDGIHWVTEKDLISPDAQDPPELEFYRLVAFPYAGRTAVLLRKYAPMPQNVNPRRVTTKHAPRFRDEWLFIREDGRWSRPFREIDASPNMWTPNGPPLRVGGYLRFYDFGGSEIVGVPEDRLFYITCHANGEFTTDRFIMPPSGLQLNVAASYVSRTQPIYNQAYVMVEILDAEQGVQGRVIEGFEKERCVLMDVDNLHYPLTWQGSDLSRLAGRAVRLRFYFRAARIYGVKESN